MLRILVVLLVLTTSSFSDAIAESSPQSVSFYVSPSGSDAWSGTLADTDSSANDGPFATITRARDAVRELKKKEPADIVVQIRGGTYPLSETVIFGRQDSGEGDATITYEAYPGETPVFCSSRPITGWRRADQALPGLPQKAQGKVLVADVSGDFKCLFDQDGMLPRARSAGFIPLKGGGRDRLHFPKGMLKDWPNVTDVEIVVRPHHAWIVNILPLKSVDEEKQIAYTSVDATYAMNSLHFLRESKSCWVENVLEALDEPGEWVLNTDQGKLYLWPRSEGEVSAPQLQELFRVEGDVDKPGPHDVPVQNLHFRGLTFQHGDRFTLANDDAGLQHDWEMHDKPTALVRLRGTENCVIEKCRFAHSGGGAIRVDLHGMNNTISSNHIEQMGGSGILLCGYGPGSKDVNKNNFIDNNHIHHVGRLYSHSPGIMLWQSGENRVANNLIHHTPYTGLIISGCMTDFFSRSGRELTRTIRWHEIGDRPGKRTQKTLQEVRPFLHTRNNAIEFNEIHHVMQELGDGNAIYIRGAGAGNVIRRNYVHHLVAPMIMQCAIRTDGGQMDTTIAENVIYKCTSQGIMLKLNTRVENNMIVDVIAPPRGYYLSVREGPLTGATIERNVFFASSSECEFINELGPGKGRVNEDRRGRALARSADAETDYNVYYCAADHRVGTEMLEQQQSKGVDVHSQAADPLFIDPENGDFRFQPDSPALKMGIVPIDVSEMGLRN
ncbi:right-handed parallel beta-helix repeat-containing protein [Allorhodopirellula solitaria]|uniref:Right handed beta helix domain-containing protein n=1 Tax=Allorhodopirellula solitaria TaxID=2527987 RepID=A0A5C5WNZ2_9BACT|nr:right-handed parallel beta-helix repeat-containing protein [Allorhodopirellula solitaria]TWT52358.1 hypothetical protein CA85_50120 [Allorhodopirellula solitaria]